MTISAPTTRGVNNTIDVRVVAIARGIGLLSMWNTFMPIEQPAHALPAEPERDGRHPDHAQGSTSNRSRRWRRGCALVLEKAGYRMMEPDPRAFWMKFQSVSREDWTGQKLDVTSWEDELSFMMWTLQALQGLTAVLIVILIAIVVIGIMNTMWIAIRERTREIGTLRAIGMQRARRAWMFLLESIMLGSRRDRRAA